MRKPKNTKGLPERVLPVAHCCGPTHNFQTLPTQHGETRIYCVNCGEVRDVTC
jgi:hypothetical protein